MQFVREKTESVERVPEGAKVLASVNGGPWRAIEAIGGAVSIPTAERGRVTLDVDGALRCFTVLATSSYDALVLGAAHFKADVQAVAGGDAASLSDFINVGYDAKAHCVAGIQRVESVGNVESPVSADLAILDMTLRNIAGDAKKAAQNDVKPDLLSIATALSDLGTALEKTLATKGPVEANVVQFNGRPEPVHGLSAFAVNGYDSKNHSVKSVQAVESVNVVQKPVLADLIYIQGNTVPVLNMEKAFNGTGYAFAGCSIPWVGEISEPVRADVRTIFGSGVAASNAAKAFSGEGYGFNGCSLPAVESVDRIPAVIISEESFRGVQESFAKESEKVVTALGALKPSAIAVSVDLKSVGGSEKAAENLRRTFDGTGWDFQNCTMDVRVKGGR